MRKFHAHCEKGEFQTIKPKRLYIELKRTEK
jgi:hypothetical protein